MSTNTPFQLDRIEECHLVVPAPQHVVGGQYPNERPSVPTLPSLNHQIPCTVVLSNNNSMTAKQKTPVSGRLCHQTQPQWLLGLCPNPTRLSRGPFCYGCALFSKAQFENCDSLAYRDLHPPQGHPHWSNKPAAVHRISSS